MKKILSIILVLVLVLSMSGMAFANNGKGKGLETAPGQDANFSKGITTIVTTNEVVSEDEIVDIETSSESSVEPKVDTKVEKVVTEELVKVYHQNAFKEDSKQPGWYRYDTVRTTVTDTTTSTWDEITTVTTTTTTVTSITTVETIEITLKHRGAPGSNGEVISETSRTISSIPTKGEPEVTTETSTEVTSGEATTTTNSVTFSQTIEGEGWIKP